MVASTDIKFYVYTNNNAPQLDNVYGSMIRVLDDCLIDGINVGTISSLTASGATVTALFSSAHNLMQYQVIKITGANQSEFNGEHRILTVPNAQSVTFELAAMPSVTTATGTITASLPPLGWEKPFSSSNPNGGGKAAYRSTNLLLPSRPFLRVVDELDPAYNQSYAKYAKVGIVEDMTDIDTMLGVQAPFDAANPNKNWVAIGGGSSVVNGWSKWYYARTNSLSSSNDTQALTNGGRQWLLVGNQDYFYILPHFIPQVGVKAANPYGFGSFKRYFNDDVGNIFLSSSIRGASASENSFIGSHSGISSNDSPNIILFKPLEQAHGFSSARAAYSVSANPHYSGASHYLRGPSSKTPLYPIILEENTSPFANNPRGVRGELLNVYALALNEPFSDLQIFNKGNDLFIARVVTVNSQNTYGQLVFRIGEL